MAYFSAIQRNELLTNATTWMNLMCIMLSERRQSQKATYWMIPFIWYSRKRKYTVIKNWLVIAISQLWREGARRLAQGNLSGAMDCPVSWLCWWLHEYAFLKTHRTVNQKEWLLLCKLNKQWNNVVTYQLHIEIMYPVWYLRGLSKRFYTLGTEIGKGRTHCAGGDEGTLYGKVTFKMGLMKELQG